MVTKKTPSGGRKGATKLTLKKETLKDLDTKGNSKDVKGGANNGHTRCTGEQSGCN